jgi:hypothetical protein
MNKKPLLAVILVLAAALLLATTAFAQEADEEPDLIRVEIRNNSDGPVFIVLTTGDLSRAQQDGTTGADMTQEEFLAQSLGLEVGLDADPDRLISQLALTRPAHSRCHAGSTYIARLPVDRRWMGS